MLIRKQDILFIMKVRQLEKALEDINNSLDYVSFKLEGKNIFAIHSSSENSQGVLVGSLKDEEIFIKYYTPEDKILISHTMTLAEALKNQGTPYQEVLTVSPAMMRLTDGNIQQIQSKFESSLVTYGGNYSSLAMRSRAFKIIT